MSLLKTTFNMQSMLQSLNKSTQCCNYTTSIKQLITHYNKYTIQQHNTTQQQRLFATSNINPLLLHPRSEPTIDQQGYTYSILNNVFSPTKCISVSLRQIYGVGPSVALQLCGELGINPLSNPTDIGIQRFEYIKRILERRYQPRHIAEKQQQPYILRMLLYYLYKNNCYYVYHYDAFEIISLIDNNT